MSKRLWIVGKQGMLGRALCGLCLERDIPFVATGRLEVDITARGEVEAFAHRERVSHIVNCAAYTAVDQAEEEIEAAFAINGRAPENLGRVGRVIHLSTDYVFDGKKEGAYTEEDEPNPLSVYGKSKREGEERLLKVQPEATIIRTSWLFDSEGVHFVSKIWGAIQEREQLRVVNDQRGKPTHCADLGEVIIGLLDKPGIFHAAGSEATTWFDWAVWIWQEAKKQGFPLRCKEVLPLNSEEAGRAAPRPLNSVLATAKIEGALDYEMKGWKERTAMYLEQERVCS